MAALRALETRRQKPANGLDFSSSSTESPQRGSEETSRFLPRRCEALDAQRGVERQGQGHKDNRWAVRPRTAGGQDPGTAGGATAHRQRELQLPTCSAQNGACGSPRSCLYSVGRTAGLVSASLPLPAATAAQAWLCSHRSTQLVMTQIMSFSFSRHSGDRMSIPGVPGSGRRRCFARCAVVKRRPPFIAAPRRATLATPPHASHWSSTAPPANGRRPRSDRRKPHMESYNWRRQSKAPPFKALHWLRV